MKTAWLIFLFLYLLADPAKAENWPVYMHDSARTGASSESLTVKYHLKWVYKARKPPFSAWPPPTTTLPAYDWALQMTVADGRLFLGSSSENKVVCLDAATGGELWSFLSDGPVRFAPSVNGDKVLFGSDDGRVRCLNAADGRLVWHCLPVPGQQWLPGNDRMIYGLPIRTDVAVLNGAGHFGAGLFPEYMGVKKCQVNLSTGALIQALVADKAAEGYLRVVNDTLYYPEAKLGFKILSRRPLPTDGATIKTLNATIKGSAGKISVSGGLIWTVSVTGYAYGLAFSDQRLFVSTDSGLIYCLTPDSTAPAARITPTTLPFAYTGTVTQTQYASAAQSVLSTAGQTKGYALVFDRDGRGGLAYALANASELRIICIVEDSAKAAALRQNLDKAGVHGRITVLVSASSALPFSDHLFNIVTHDGFASGAEYSGSFSMEAVRVLKPYGGTLLLSATPVRKGPVDKAGEWTHSYANAGNNPTSLDPYAGHTYSMHWFGRPGPEHTLNRHTRNMSPLWKNGILISPGNHWVSAVDAYNGTVLWEKSLLLSIRVPQPFFTGYMVLQDDYLYAVSGRNCLALRPREGDERMAFSIPSTISNSSDQWGWVACAGDLLFGSVIPQVPTEYQGYSWTAEKLAHGPHAYYLHEISKGLFARGRHDNTQPPRWTYVPDSGAIVSSTIALVGDKLVFVESTNPYTKQSLTCTMNLPDLLGNGKSRLVALNAATGVRAWTRTMDLSEVQFCLLMISSQGKLFLQGTRAGIADTTWGRMAYCIYGFDAQTGDSLWKTYLGDGMLENSHGVGLRYPVVLNNRYHVKNGGTLDIATGQVVKNVGVLPTKCGTVTASATHIFGRDWNHASMEVATGTGRRLTTTTRPACWMTMVPAGGMLCMPEGQDGCTCAFSIQTSIGLLSAGASLPAASTAVELNTGEPVPEDKLALSNYPNPFNRTTQIAYSIPPQRAGSAYALRIFDVRGRCVRTLIQGLVGTSGIRRSIVRWDGLDDSGTPSSSGLYYYRVDCGGKAMTRSLLFIK